MLKVTQTGRVCLDFICLLHHMLLLICCLRLGGVLSELVLSPTFRFCCLWNVCSSSYIHIYFLNIPLCPLLFILTRQELPWFVRLVMWSSCLMAISHVYKLSQTTFMSQNTDKCSSAELLVPALPAKGSDWDRENTKQTRGMWTFYWLVGLSVKRVLQQFCMNASY